MRTKGSIYRKFEDRIDPQMIKELESKDIFRILFESAGEGLILVNKSGIILMANPSVEEMFNYGKDELIGKVVETLIPDSFHSKHAQYRNNYTEHPKKRSMGKGISLSGKTRDGNIFPVEISLNYFNAGADMVVMALITNITERKKIEDDFQKLNAELEKRVEERTEMLAGAISELEEANQSLKEAQDEARKNLQKEMELGELKSRFVSNASHEFRTPLATILSSVSLISRFNNKEDEEKRSRHIERIKSSVNNMREILDDFLSIGKLEEGKIENRPEKIDLHLLCNSLVEEIQMTGRENQVINFIYSGENFVCIDPLLFKNICLNLLSNSLKFSGEGGPINFSVQVKREHILIAIEDKGIGMSEEDQKHLFERFFRGKNALNIQGTGLGLNIVKKYVELMNGELNVKSKLGKGTTFQIVLPNNNL